MARQIMCDICDEPRLATVMTTILDTGDTQALCVDHMLLSAVELILTATEDMPDIRSQIVEQLTLVSESLAQTIGSDDDRSRGDTPEPAGTPDSDTGTADAAAGTSDTSPSVPRRDGSRSSAHHADMATGGDSVGSTGVG